MRERPTFHAEFGEYVRGLRVRLNDAHPGRWTLRGAADLAHRRGLASLTRQILFRLEQGQTRHPDANVLMEVADLYGVPYDATPRGGPRRPSCFQWRTTGLNRLMIQQFRHFRPNSYPLRRAAGRSCVRSCPDTFRPKRLPPKSPPRRPADHPSRVRLPGFTRGARRFPAVSGSTPGRS